MSLVPGFQNMLFSESQTNQNKQNLILISFSSSLHVAYITTKQDWPL